MVEKRVKILQNLAPKLNWTVISGVSRILWFVNLLAGMSAMLQIAKICNSQKKQFKNKNNVNRQHTNKTILFLTCEYFPTWPHIHSFAFQVSKHFPKRFETWNVNECLCGQVGKKLQVKNKMNLFVSFSYISLQGSMTCPTWVHQQRENKILSLGSISSMV